MKKIVTLLTSSLFIASCCAYATETATPHKKNTWKEAQTAPATEATESPLSGNFNITSNYMFRGVSSSNNLPAPQGGFTYTFHKTGIYFNIWGSSVNLTDYQGNTATTEFDMIAGVRRSIGEHFSFDINLDRYTYPKSDLSYNEAIASAQWYFLTALVGFSSNVYNKHGDGTYYNAGVSYDIPPRFIFDFEDMNFTANVGRYHFARSTGYSTYTDYLVGLKKTWGNYVVSVQWTNAANSAFNLENDPARGLRNQHLVGTVLVNF